MSFAEIRLHLRVDRRAAAAQALRSLEISAAAAIAPHKTEYVNKLATRLEKAASL
jgi:hypothetical protein